MWSAGVLEKWFLDTAMEGHIPLRPMMISWNQKISPGCSSLTVDLELRLLMLANPLFYRYNSKTFSEGWCTHNHLRCIVLAGIALRSICMKITNGIEVNPKVMMGKPVIRGTRITVELILRKLSEGATHTELLEAYPKLTRKSIQTAIRYAADTLSHEEMVVINAPKRSAWK
jgi:uncharacterized protein (DUF433 family)